MLLTSRFFTMRSLKALAFAGAILLPAGCVRAARDASLVQLIERAEAANEAFINGDMRRWYELASPIAEDFTLMQPLGGVSRGFDGSDAHLDELARVFTQGRATFELIEAYATRDMVVLVFIERQTAIVAGLPEQDWSLRVTQVFRRRGDQWELAHRHADTLVDNIGMERTADLARIG